MKRIYEDVIDFCLDNDNLNEKEFELKLNIFLDERRYGKFRHDLLIISEDKERGLYSINNKSLGNACGFSIRETFLTMYERLNKLDENLTMSEYSEILLQTMTKRELSVLVTKLIQQNE